MANQRSGPIRRPTLDLEARRKQAKPDETSPLEHAADEDERDTLDPGEPLPGEDLPREAVEAPQGGMSGADQRFSNPAPPPPQRPWGRRAGPRILLVLGGGVVGLALAYGLALAGLWPDPTDTGALASRLALLEARAPEPIPEGVAPEALSALEARVAQLEAAPLPEGPDEAEAALAALANQVAELDARLSTLTAAGPEVDGETLDAVAQLSRGLETAQSGLAELAAQVATFEGRVTSLEAAFADQPTVEAISAERDRFAQWPMALSSLRNRVAEGLPFASELAALRSLAPDLPVPPEVAAASGSGVDDLASLNQRFAQAIPDMLRARPANPDASWTQQLLEQAGAALALRPSGAIEGEGPDVEIARAEAALDAGNLEGALAALARLPEPMRQAAGTVPQAIAARAAVEAFLVAAEEYGPMGSGEPQE